MNLISGTLSSSPFLSSPMKELFDEEDSIQETQLIMKEKDSPLPLKVPKVMKESYCVNSLPKKNWRPPQVFSCSSASMLENSFVESDPFPPPTLAHSENPNRNAGITSSKVLTIPSSLPFSFPSIKRSKKHTSSDDNYSAMLQHHTKFKSKSLVCTALHRHSSLDESLLIRRSSFTKYLKGLQDRSKRLMEPLNFLDSKSQRTSTKRSQVVFENLHEIHTPLELEMKENSICSPEPLPNVSLRETLSLLPHLSACSPSSLDKIQPPPHISSNVPSLPFFDQGRPLKLVNISFHDADDSLEESETHSDSLKIASPPSNFKVMEKSEFLKESTTTLVPATQFGNDSPPSPTLPHSLVVPISFPGESSSFDDPIEESFFPTPNTTLKESANLHDRYKIDTLNENETDLTVDDLDGVIGNSFQNYNLPVTVMSSHSVKNPLLRGIFE